MFFYKKFASLLFSCIRLLDGAQGAPNMHRLASLLKMLNIDDDHLVLGSEACHCPSTGYAGGKLDVAWSRAERYAHSILSDLAAGSNGKCHRYLFHEVPLSMKFLII